MGARRFHGIRLVGGRAGASASLLGSDSLERRDHYSYDHLFMGNPSVTFPASAIAVTRSDNIAQGVDMATVRVNYRFGGAAVAR
jgi:hypothetical protein